MSDHVESLSLYFSIFVALMVLLAATVAAAFFHLPGFLNIVVTIAIAGIKTILIVLYFMHVRHNPKIIWICVTVGFFFLGIMLVFLMSDYMSRGWLPHWDRMVGM